MIVEEIARLIFINFFPQSHSPYTSTKRWMRPFSAIIFIDRVLKELRNRSIPVNDDLVIELDRILHENYGEALKDTKTLPVVTDTLRMVFG